MPIIIIIKKTFSENTVVHYYCFYYSQGETSEYGDQHQFSPNDIHTLSRDYVMRINKMITWEKMP